MRDKEAEMPCLIAKVTDQQPPQTKKHTRIDKIRSSKNEDTGKLVRARFASRIPSVLSLGRTQSAASSSLLGSMEETILRGRVEPVQLVDNFRIEFGACGTRESGEFFCPDHRTIGCTAKYYSFDSSVSPRMSSAYMTCVDLGPKGYEVPRKGQVQVTLFNPHGTVVKMFLIAFDHSDMPPNCETFLRQRVYYMPQDAPSNHPHLRKWLRYLIHIRFRTSKRKDKVYVFSDCRVLVLCKSDTEAFSDQQSELDETPGGNKNEISRKSVADLLSVSPRIASSSPSSLSTGTSNKEEKQALPSCSRDTSHTSLPMLSPTTSSDINVKAKQSVWCTKSFTEHPTNPRYSNR